MIIKALKKGLVFSFIVIIILFAIGPIFIAKIGHRGKLIEGLYNNTGDTYDVLLMGSSHMNSSINPNLLWNEYGITSYNYGTGGQPIDVTYYLLKETLIEHNPKIVVVDAYYLGLIDEFGSESYIRYVIDNMKFSFNKIEAIINCTPKEQWISYFFPIFRYHDRWKELTYNDFNYDSSEYYYTKGFGAGREIYGEDLKADLSVTDVGEIPLKSEEYLYKIIELSKTEDFQLIFTSAPHDYTSTAGASNWYEDPAAMFNKVSEITEENNISFINFCNLLNEMDFDFSKDMYNIGHMNIWGSNKVTTYFGKYLSKNYDLIDHRDDEKFIQWDLDYKKYMNMKLEEEKDGNN